jgi:hypothetical protein
LELNNGNAVTFRAIPPQAQFWASAAFFVETFLQLWVAPDYRSRPFLQLALSSFEEWRPDLNMKVLFQSNSFVTFA